MRTRSCLVLVAVIFGLVCGCKRANRGSGRAVDGGQPSVDAGAGLKPDAAVASGARDAGARDGSAGGAGAVDASTGTRDGSSAAAPDAGSARSFPSDRSQFGLGGPSRCTGADVLLCEGFESGAIDAATWSIDTWGKGTALIDGARAARGSHSVHINEPADVSRVMLRETKTFATTGNHFFGRFFLYLPYTAPALQCPNGTCNNLVHWTAAAAGGVYAENSMSYQPDVRAVGAVNQNLLVNLDGGPKAEVGVSDDSSAPTGYGALDASHVNQWMCFEFEYAGQADTAEVRVFWDGLEHPALHYSTAHRGDKGELWAIPKYDHLDFGFTHYQNYSSAVAGFDAWIDEIAVDTRRIGCAL